MTSTVLISGGAGFIGTRLTSDLLDATDRRIVLLDNLHPQVHARAEWPLAASSRLQLVQGDAVEITDWRRAIDACDGPIDVIHLAAETGTGQSLTEARRHAGVNALGTATLTDALSERGLRPRSITLTSSRAVYGEGTWTDANGAPRYADPRTPQQLEAGVWEPMSDEHALATPLPHRATAVEPRPANIYAATKLAQEHILSSWCRAMGVPLTILRLQNVYGAGQALQNSYTGVLTYFAVQLLRHEVIDVYEGGGIIRDFVHVSDVVAAMRSVLETVGSSIRTFDIGSTDPRTLLEVASTMAEIVDGPAPRVTARYRLGDVRAAFADASDARDQLGYRPRTALRDGLTELLEFARDSTAAV